MAEWTDKAITRSDIALSPTRPILAGHSKRTRTAGLNYHMHFGLELGIVMRGRKRYMWRDHQRRYGPGDVWLCGMWEPHGYAYEQAPCEYVVLVIKPQLLASWTFAEAPGFNALSPFAAGPRDRPRVAKANRPGMVRLARRIARHADDDSDEAALWLRHLLLEVLMLLPSKSDEATPAYGFDQVDKAMQMVMQSR
jgi:hypothetical protein